MFIITTKVVLRSQLETQKFEFETQKSKKRNWLANVPATVARAM